NMLQPGDYAPPFSILGPRGKPGSNSGDAGRRPTLLTFIETDCPTCRLTLPYLVRLSDALGQSGARVIAISQDPEESTRQLVEQMAITFPVVIDHDLSISRLFDPQIVPTIFLLDGDGKITRIEAGFDKAALNSVAEMMALDAGLHPATVADEYDGAPASKPGCSSRHLETQVDAPVAPSINLSLKRGSRASQRVVEAGIDPYDYCLQEGFADPLPVVPPTIERVERMMAAVDLPPDEVIGLIPPNYAVATVEKIAANAVMAGCVPEMMRVLVPLVRALCDERFNVHGVQATTHFAAPLIILNGPVRKELGFASGGNVFSNVARANSTLGRAAQLILTNLGGARPGEIDMSTLGNPGKFSYCIAENEEQSPWEPFHVQQGFDPSQSTISLFAAEPPKGLSEHNARTAREVLKAFCPVLAVSWSYLFCGMAEAIVVIGPEHAKTIHSEGFSKEDVRSFLFENTGIPLRAYRDSKGEGSQYVKAYREILIDGEPCYQKFSSPEAINIIVAGGTAGKFSAVISSWATGPRGSQMVIYPIEVA
ncbi:MAG TPA: TlpA disulfide reductase family protein, partial [Blastocatellia bacterium]|nr:TlpA disulfide reductase family protein [Blastocatellia bacterium]